MRSRHLLPLFSSLALSVLVACGTTDGNDHDDPSLLDAGTDDTSLENPDVSVDTDEADSAETDTDVADTDVDDTNTTEPDTSEPDTGSDTDADTDTGGDIGVGSPDDEYIPPILVPDACGDLCQQLEEECGITEILGEPCPSYCESSVDDDQRHLASFVCATQSCDPTCFDHPPEVTDACVDFCDEMIGCDLSDEFDLPDDPGVCAIVCAGIERTTEALVPEIFACMADTFDATCDMALAEQCYAVHPWEFCNRTCSDLGEGCDASTAFGELGVDGCVDECMLRDNIEGVWAWAFCASMTTCDGFATCADVPVDTPPVCGNLCDDAIATCPDEGQHGLTPDQLCGAMCSALDTLPAHDAAGAQSCVMGDSMCYYDDPEVPSYISRVAGCMLNAPPVCEEACASLAACDPASDFLGDCLFVCTTKASTDEGVEAEMEACLDEATAPCAEAGCLRALQ